MPSSSLKLANYMKDERSLGVMLLHLTGPQFSTRHQALAVRRYRPAITSRQQKRGAHFKKVEIKRMSGFETKFSLFEPQQHQCM